MNQIDQQTVLVIDDSATIRRLVDRCLTAAGYRVVAAATAEDGVKFAESESPDVILLDHQLPGTTGTDVASKLREIPGAEQVPIIVSSTLRKKAYAEYLELPNVVDMLPKPYTEVLLETTVENALSTAAIVVSSQSQGTAVPEVLRSGAEPDLSGRLGTFGVRELLDFVNNSGKSGVLEVEGSGYRVFFYVEGGRVSGVSASGVSADEVTCHLPESLQNLAPVVNLTLAGRGASELDGLVELLNRKVVDSRLLRRLLRHQAAVLVWKCFTTPMHEFRFTANGHLPPLFAKLPLEISVLALIIEGTMASNEDELPSYDNDSVFVRRAVRGQNLDRAGVSPQYMKALNLLGERHSADAMAAQMGWSLDEARRVLHGLFLADLVERTEPSQARHVIVYEPDPILAGQLREAIAADPLHCYGKVVRDRVAMQLVLRRGRPDVFVFNLSCDDAIEFMKEQQSKPDASDIRWIGVLPADLQEDTARATLSRFDMRVDAVLRQPFDSDLFCEMLFNTVPQEELAHSTQYA